MNKNKPRGSQDGLKQNRELTKITNTESMWKIVNKLRKEKSSSLWTYKEVWSSAGLKSPVALNSHWNSHIRSAIDNHNSQLKENAELGPIGQAKRRTLRDSNRVLRDQLNTMRKERDQALSKIAIFEADALHFKSQYEIQLNITDRLRSQLKTPS